MEIESLYNIVRLKLMMREKRYLRLSEHKLFLGVVGGFSEFLGIDKTFLRVIFATFVVITGFFPGAVVYFIAWYIMRAAAEEAGEVIEVDAKKKKKKKKKKK